MQEAGKDSKQLVSDLVRSHLSKLLGGSSLKAYHKAFNSSLSGSLMQAAVKAEVDISLQLATKEAALKALLKTGEECLQSE